MLGDKYTDITLIITCPAIFQAANQAALLPRPSYGRRYLHNLHMVGDTPVASPTFDMVGDTYTYLAFVRHVCMGLLIPWLPARDHDLTARLGARTHECKYYSQ